MTLQEFGARLDRLGSGGLAEAIRPVLIRGSILVREWGTASLQATHRTRTGRLLASISGTVEVRDGSPAIVARAGGAGGRGTVRYARLQEQGGVVVPVHAKMLRIPLPVALTPAGVVRDGLGGGPLRVIAPDRFYCRRSKAGNLLLFERATGIPWFVLRSSVTIPARPYLRPAVERVAREYLRPALSQAVVGAVRGAA